MITVRRAHREDVADILRIYNDDERRTILEDLSRLDAYIAVFDIIDQSPDDGLYVAERDGKIAGTFQLTFLRNLSELTAHVELVHVARAARSHGVGEAMMHQAIALARARKCVRVQLTTHKSRERAHGFYARLGFTASHEGMTLPL